MSRPGPSSDDHKLINQLSPDPGWGRLLGALATTYEMQPEFFETDFLPTLLGLGAWDDRNWSSRIALEKHLAELEAASVLMDARPYRGRPRSLRVEIQPVTFPGGGVLHAKILLSAYEYVVRLAVGSANLTEPGYRRNREVAAVLTASADRPVEARVISQAIEGFNQLSGDWGTQGTTEVCRLALEQLAQWRSNEVSTDEWFVWSGGSTPLWKQVLERWPKNEKANRITLVSPFWSEEQPAGPVIQFVTEMKCRGHLAENAELRLLTDAAPDRQSTYSPRLPESFHVLDASTIGIKAHALAVDPRVPPEEVGMGEEFTGTRALHAKVALLESRQASLAYFGSANFTRRGWGFLSKADQANVEAGVILRRYGDDGKALRDLLPPTTGSPVELSGAAMGRLAIPDPSPEELPWPTFLREVLLSPSRDSENLLELVVVLGTSGSTGSWELLFLPSEDRSPETLLSTGADDAIRSEHRLALTEEQLCRLLRDQEVLVRWNELPDGRSFPINVTAEARTALPISPGSGNPAEQDLLAYYQGRITWEDLFPDPAELDQSTTQSTSDVGTDQHVDTSRIQSYVVRELVEALKGINDDLRQAAQSTRACMRLALLGTVSPVALARSVLDAAGRGERSPTAAGFQLVEILGCLDAALCYETSSALTEDWHSLVAEAGRAVRRMIDDLQERHPNELSRGFRRYARAVGNLHRVERR